MSAIDAEPTKEFFISMLTRDISLLSAVIDLIDNSVDAALAQNGNLGDSLVELTLSRNKFEIIDNCGGISKVAAEQYAFKFGRPSSAPATPHSVGRFGVGMKRALFKIGSDLSIKSGHQDGSFEINVDVNQWLNQRDSWTFELTDCEMSDLNGTLIAVEELHATIGEKFGDDAFIRTLITSIGKAHFHAINNGLVIKINGMYVPKKDIEIKLNDNLSVAGKEFTLNDVDISIKVGVGERNLHSGGWYVFCNGRMIEGANKSRLTGWGVEGIRAYHADVAFFRGVIEFNCEDGAKLPWNTTKTGIDSDSPIYRTALIEMKLAMRKVIELLKDRVKEQEDIDSGRSDLDPINSSISDASLNSIFSAPIISTFVRPPRIVVPRRITERRISYTVSNELLNEVKERLGASTNKEVGELTFEYYRSNEI